MWISGAIIVGYAIPGFLVGILLIILFAGGSFFNVFPLRGLTSDNWAQMSVPGKIVDYFWHLVLPMIAMGLGAYATMTLLTKNSFLDEIRKQYVLTARAKGCTQSQVLYGHVFRNAMLIVIAGFPGAFVHAFFSGSLLIETIFSLDGIGLLGFESVLNRDYAVVFATVYILSLIGLVVNLLSDLTYTWVDPRIDSRRERSESWTIEPASKSRKRRRNPRWGWRSRRKGICWRCRRSTPGAGRASRQTGGVMVRSGFFLSCS